MASSVSESTCFARNKSRRLGLRAVWSFWTKPFLVDRRFIWTTERHHLLSWILSFHTARQHFEKTALFTDDNGARLLVDDLGIEFDEVSTELNVLKDHDHKWWALGKIYTYRLQTRPFIHIDSDVFLWNKPSFNSEAPLVAQNPEHFRICASYYMPERFELAVKQTPGGWLPTEWEWYRSRGGVQRAESCGIFGGARTDFIRYYAGLAIQFIEHPANQSAWRNLSHDIERNILAEQYLLSACIEYHRNLRDSPYQDLRIQYLFNSQEESFNPKRAAAIGYTHLIAASKRNKYVTDNLEKRVKRDYPAQYERCATTSRRNLGNPDGHLG